MVTIDEKFVEHSRLVRPFNVKRLHDVLYQALTMSSDIYHRAERLRLDPPRLAEDYVEELHSIVMALETLADSCTECIPRIEMLIEQAPGDQRRAVDGLVAMIRGLQQAEASGASEAPLAA